MRRLRRRVGIGAPDPWLTPVSGMAAVTELVDRLGMITLLDAAIGKVKSRDRGLSGGQLLVGLACAQLAGEDFLVGLDRQRADVAGQVLAPVAGLSSTTAAGLARRLSEGQWRAVETGIGDVHAAMLAALPPARVVALCGEVTIDLDTTDVEVYGRKKRGVAFNYQGQRCGRPHVATWAQTATVLAADLMAGDEDPRSHAPGLLRRALGALPAAARCGRIRLRADAGYFAGALARAALLAGVEFAIGAKRIAPLWRLLGSVPETGWTDAVDMDGAQVAVASWCPDWWPAATRLLIRRVRLDITAGAVSADPRSRRRRTLHPDQRALPLAELAEADAVYGYSFIAILWNQIRPVYVLLVWLTATIGSSVAVGGMPISRGVGPAGVGMSLRRPRRPSRAACPSSTAARSSSVSGMEVSIRCKLSLASRSWALVEPLGV
ncbi:MAG: transposase [Pseudonocardiaceae bacterium]